MGTHQERATALGMTRTVTVTTATDELYGYVNPAESLDDTFTLLDADNGEFIVVKGWLAEVNPEEED